MISRLRKASFSVIKSGFSKTGSEVEANRAAFLQSREQLLSRIASATSGGPASHRERHRSRNKLLPRERINAILDEGSPFLELSQLAGHELYAPDEVPSGGIVTGIGKIHNKLCMIVCNDATVKGGTYFPITVKKHVRAQEIALENRLPCVYIVDSGGANLPRQDEIFPDKNHFGRIFFNQAQMSSQGIPQVAVVCGSCTAGGAYVPAMSDESVIVHKNGTIFLAGPPLVKAATQEDVSAEELGGGRMHSSVSGVTDHFAQDEPHALSITRSIIGNIPTEFAIDSSEEIEEPLYDIADIASLMPRDLRNEFDVRHLLARVLDGSKLHEFKKMYGQNLVTGFGKLYGKPVGVVASNRVLASEDAVKATHFIELCDQRRIPLIFIQNINGFCVGKDHEQAGIAKHGAKMVTAVATTTVPKITLIIGSSYGAGNYGLCGRAYSPRFLYMWPNAKISVMGGEQADTVMRIINGNKWTEENSSQLRQKYEVEGSAYYSTARLWDDGIIDPFKTREVLGLSLHAAIRNMGDRSPFGVFRI